MFPITNKIKFAVSHFSLHPFADSTVIQHEIHFLSTGDPRDYMYLSLMLETPLLDDIT